MKVMSCAAIGVVLGVGISGIISSSVANAAEIAKVNGQSISDKDLSSALSALNEGTKQSYLSDVNNRREVLANIIDREVSLRRPRSSSWIRIRRSKTP